MCPNCDYSDDWQGAGLEQPTDNYGGHGGFFTLNKPLMKQEHTGDMRRLWGCPKCNKVFINY